jgi:putative transcriptional regulator
VIPVVAFLLAVDVGKLVVATEQSHDPDLAKSVVLIIHSDKDGTMGLILNRPVKDLYFGGPVALGARCLFRASKPNGERIVEGVYLSNKPVAGGRIYAGYVGWSTVQLNDEISRGLWKIRDATEKIIFDPNPSTLWQRLSK